MERKGRLWNTNTDTCSCRTDRQSEHYPGFDIHYDPTDKARPEEERREEADEDGTKENSQPVSDVRKGKKTVSLPLVAKRKDAGMEEERQLRGNGGF